MLLTWQSVIIMSYLVKLLLKLIVCLLLTAVDCLQSGHLNMKLAFIASWSSSKALSMQDSQQTCRQDNTRGETNLLLLDNKENIVLES